MIPSLTTQNPPVVDGPNASSGGKLQDTSSHSSHQTSIGPPVTQYRGLLAIASALSRGCRATPIAAAMAP